jgi:hypothetical protein
MPATESVTISAQAHTPVSPQRAFEIVAPIALPSILKRSGPLPGVAEVRDQSGPWDATGRTRQIVLTDKSTMRETLIEYDSGHSFAYRLTDFGGLLGAMASGVRGEWAFTPDGSGAIIRWTWELAPKPGRSPFVRLVLAPLMRRNMAAACVRAAAACDAR